MSWLFSQALVAAFSGANSSDGEPCAPLSVMPTPHKFWRNDKTMECSTLSRFGLTCAVLTEDHGAALLTSFLEASRARTSPAPGRAQGLTGNDPASGLRWPGSFARFDPASSSWKTAQCSLLEGLDEFSETWPRWGSMRTGECWAQTMPEHLTSERGSGFWPTPTKSDADKWSNQSLAERRAKGQQVRLNTAVTPEGGGGGQLNPPWVEWLMGWPIGWTGLEPLETDKFQAWLRSHGKLSCAAQPKTGTEHVQQWTLNP
jgi:hypothetical protein